MNRRIVISMFLALSFSFLFGQVPQAFKYQAVIRDTTGNVLPGKFISLRISILQNDINGVEVYREIHDVHTDKLGLVNLNIGEGMEVSRDFSEIPWGEGPFFIKLEIDLEGGMDYHYLGTSQLMSVPYALYAENAGDNYWGKGENGIHYTNGRVGIGTDDPQKTLDVAGSSALRANTTLGSGNWIGLYFNGYGDDDQPEWLFASHNQGGFQFRRWDGEDFSEHYLKVDEGRFRFGAYDCPPLMYHFHGWSYITDSLQAGNGKFKVSQRGHLNIEGDGTPDRMIIAENNGHTRIAGISAVNKKYYRPQFEGLRARGSLDGPQNLQTDDCIMSLMALPYYDGEYRQAAGIEFYAGESTGEKGYPAYITFQTSGQQDTVRYERMRITEDGRVGIGTTDPAHYKLFVSTSAYNDERAIAHFRNENSSTKSLCNVYVSAGDSGSTYINYTAPSYIHQGGKYKMHTLMGNNGKGMVFRTGWNDDGRFAFEFRRELGNTYIYDEKVSITYEGNMGIGIIQPQRKLHINDVMRLEPRYSPPEDPSEGDIYMDGNDHVLKVYDGSQWRGCW